MCIGIADNHAFITSLIQTKQIRIPLVKINQKAMLYA